ncbi:type III-B CRISPR module-associated protein Cmr3 [Kroppenstedtia pulmonis]|uniref:Type III-B CRISPR module-associated protein Cmr3 n=1 Tax=Kroppenstedtia pulmonis TaxID=1380685 RepID=A0A7D4CJX6_9BACL|nr:type III-B CRISPR module-associated Cmr3 family protein [Kroppenstedtia pulmonis]QKG83298.1 type III-B CRISPR module-associated protein Cmr3 [Kroppenstedtia pulmonis]
MKWWIFRPLDTWFFRGGMPFNRGEKSAVQPESVFPPPMQTLQGAIRTTLAQRQGWKPGNPLPSELGDPNSLGNLGLTGPILLYGEQEVLFPAPNLLVGEKSPKKPWQLTRLSPGPAVWTDMGKVSLPVPLDKTVKGKALDVWLNRQGMEAVLSGGMPLDQGIYRAKDLWEAERRVGLMRDEKTRTAKDHHLYMPIHTRPRQGLAVAVGVQGVPEDWHPQETVVSLGGEGRSAAVEVRDQLQQESSEWLTPPELVVKEDRLFYTVTLITPGSFPDKNEAAQRGLPGLPGCCRSACIGKPEQIGGWDVVNNRPRPLKPWLPAGSTWWMEADEQDQERVVSLHGAKIGSQTEYGMGQLVIGTWNGEVTEE